jgi:hypothetical protein
MIVKGEIIRDSEELTVTSFVYYVRVFLGRLKNGTKYPSQYSWSLGRDLKEEPRKHKAGG